MLQTRFLVVVPIVAFASIASASPSATGEIKALYTRWNRAFEAMDVNGIRSCYAPDVYAFDVVPPRAYPNRAAYMKDYAGLFAMFKKISSSVDNLSITVVGDVAYTHCVTDMRATPKGGGQSQHMVVRVTDVLRKRHGRWAVVQEHVSVPVDMMTGKPDMLSKP